LLIELQGFRSEAAHVPIVALFRLSTSHPPQPGHRLLGNLHEPGRRPHPTTFTQMANDIVGFGLRELCIKQGGAAALGAFLPTGATAQQAHTVIAIDLPDDQVACPGTLKQVACRIDTR
jgi:hypothetical protein